MKWYLFLCLCLTSCGREAEHIVDERALQYVQRFQGEVSIRGLNIPFPHGDVTFAVLGSTEAGVCNYKEGMDHWNIQIDEPYWNTLGDYSRMEIVFHELGHCMFRKEHRNGTHIMSPELLFPGVFENRYLELVDDLFN